MSVVYTDMGAGRGRMGSRICTPSCIFANIKIKEKKEICQILIIEIKIIIKNRFVCLKYSKNDKQE
jgi:hypothetical protein